MGILAVITIFVIIFNLLKDAITDAHCREYARKMGLDFYASSTGLRNTKNGEKYYK